MMYPHRIPRWFQSLFPRYQWVKPGDTPTLYLTFDDGPIPKVTPWVLEILAQYKVPATFFWVGANVVRHPEIAREVVAQGHTVGNHSHTHKKGWRTRTSAYLDDVAKAQTTIAEVVGKPITLFRPPYGRITPAQSKQLGLAYDLVMWSVLSGDFDSGLSPAACLAGTQKATQNGGIVVFHDSLKAEKRLRAVLPAYIEWALAQGYQFSAL